MQFISTAIGIAIMLAIDIIGALASRKFRFNYAWLSLVSFANYLLVGYIHAKNGFASTAVFSAAFVGLLDATIGLWLCIKCKAYIGNNKLKWEPRENVGTTIFVTATAATLGWLGSLVA